MLIFCPLCSFFFQNFPVSVASIITFLLPLVLLFFLPFSRKKRDEESIGAPQIAFVPPVLCQLVSTARPEKERSSSAKSHFFRHFFEQQCAVFGPIESECYKWFLRFLLLNSSRSRAVFDFFSWTFSYVYDIRINEKVWKCINLQCETVIPVSESSRKVFLLYLWIRIHDC